MRGTQELRLRLDEKRKRSSPGHGFIFYLATPISKWLAGKVLSELAYPKRILNRENIVICGTTF